MQHSQGFREVKTNKESLGLNSVFCYSPPDFFVKSLMFFGIADAASASTN